MQYRAGELAVDRITHVMGTLAGVVGSAIIVGIAAAIAVIPTFSASLVYSVCLVTMFGCSAAYNLAANSPRREVLRRLDHAAGMGRAGSAALAAARRDSGASDRQFLIIHTER